MINKRKDKEKEWKEKILEFLENNPSGYTITGLAKNINSTRITVSKYLSLLEQENKVLCKEVGVYKLYFSAERRYIALNIYKTFYKALIWGVKQELSNEDTFKKSLKDIGFVIAETLSEFLVNHFPESLRGHINSFRDFLIYFGRVIPHLDFIFAGDMTIQEEINTEIEKGIYIFKKPSVLDFTEELEYHFYILSGLIERTLSNIFITKPVQCNVASINKKEKTVTLVLERP